MSYDDCCHVVEFSDWTGNKWTGDETANALLHYPKTISNVNSGTVRLELRLRVGLWTAVCRVFNDAQINKLIERWIFFFFLHSGLLLLQANASNLACVVVEYDWHDIIKVTREDVQVQQRLVDMIGFISRTRTMRKQRSQQHVTAICWHLWLSR